MYNRVILVGNLTRDVELRYLPSGSAIAKFGLATNRRYKRQDGNTTDEVCFIDINLFGRTAEVANQYLRKGSKVLIEGQLLLESWVDQSGQKRSRHSVTADSMQMLDSKSQATNSYDGYEQHNQSYDAPQGYNNPPIQQKQNQQRHQGQDEYGNNNNANNIPEIDINDEDVPF